MRVSNEDWSRYIRQLSAVNRKAAEVMQAWMDEHPNAEGEDLVATAYAVSEHYGDAAGSLACSMYDALAEAQGAAVPPAEPAPNATYDETAKAVYGTLKNKQSTVPATVGRLVKQTGADTMLQNAQRDRAQFAWIPMGDTCAFCLTLGSRGWQNQSKKAMKNGHAEHIHANCDCQYAVRFDGRSTVEGYDPDALKAQYDSFKIGLPKNGNGGIVKNIRLPAELDSVPGMSEDTRDAISKDNEIALLKANKYTDQVNAGIQGQIAAQNAWNAAQTVSIQNIQHILGQVVKPFVPNYALSPGYGFAQVTAAPEAATASSAANARAGTAMRSAKAMISRARVLRISFMMPPLLHFLIQVGLCYHTKTALSPMP